MKIKDKFLVHSFYIPALLLFSLFIIYPLISQFYYSFFEWKGIGEASFVGFRNYIDILSSRSFYNALRNNFIFLFVVYIVQNGLAIFIAVTLSLDIRGKPLVSRGNTQFRGLFFVPVVVSTIVVSYAFSYILGNDGSLNYLIDVFHLSFLKQGWLGDSRFTLLVVAAVHVWKFFGYYVLIYYAGLMLIPRELYDASEIDGANLFQKIWFITFPQLVPSFAIVSILTFLDCFRAFDIPFLITGGGPNESSTLVSLLIVKNTIKYYKFGYGSAISSLTYILLFLISFIFLKYIVRKEVDK